MKKLVSLMAVSLWLVSGAGHAQVVGDLTGSVEQFTKFIPAIACKTRTNNDASVRNLAKGVFNSDSSSLVPLNCGWNTSAAWTYNFGFANDARADGELHVFWVRTAGTPLSQANDSFCSLFAAEPDDLNSPPNVNGTMIGTVSPTFVGPVGADEIDDDFATTAGLAYPNSTVGNNFAGNEFAQFTAFCRVAQGVRLQEIVQDADTVGSHP